MAVKRFSSSFRTRDDVFDNITPNNIVVTPTGGVAVPAGEFKPADWLPVAWQGTASQDYFVIGSGKVVSMTKRGNICLGGLNATINAGTAAVGDACITYTSADVEAKTKNVTTGQDVTALEVAAGALSLADVADGLVDRGLVREEVCGTGAPYDNTLIADVQAVLNDFISAPIGVSAYDVYSWGGELTDERGLDFTNYQKQHLVQFFTQAQMQMPVIGLAQTTGVDVSGATAFGASGTSFPASVGGGVVWASSAELSALARYSDDDRASMLIEAGDPVIGYALATDSAGGSLARHTDRTPFADGASAGIFTNKRDNVASLRNSGDFFVDAEAGLVIVRSDAWDATGASNTGLATTLSYYHHDSATPAASSDDRLVSLLAVTDAKPGDTIGFDEWSNLTVDATGTLGRVIAIKEEPRGLMDRVRTGFEGSSFDASMQMPGSATGGFTDLITLSNETVADRVAVLLVNFL
jgi:hypothetical protein